MTQTFDIAIVGGGITGPTLALALARAGLSICVIDKAPATIRKNAAFDGRASALALTSVRMLQALGIWNLIADKAQPILKIRVSDGRAGEGAAPFFLNFDHAEIEEGPMGHMCENRFLRRALLEAIKDNGSITTITDSVTDQRAEVSGVTLTLENGTPVEAKLIVGCDGRGSATAARAGITRTGWGYDQTALVACVAHEQPHAGIAHQFFMPPGPLAILPLPGNVSSIVWSENARTAADFEALSDAEFVEVLRPRFGDFLGDISLRGDRFSYPLSLSIANSFVADRTVLVGDAAHGIHPIAGQGLNAGMRDVAALAQVLTEALQRGEDIAGPAVLARYQQWRRFDTTTLALTTDLTNRLFSNDNPLLRCMRDLGMGAINAVPSLRRAMIREAAGLTGDVPDLMRG
ncbi:MAG: FAD-dependent oxidoreductase [Pseudomonadota bacterium]